jgi:hypothetical protein
MTLPKKLAQEISVLAESILGSTYEKYLRSPVATVTEAAEPVGREYQHIEDLVYIYGPQGAIRALDRIKAIDKNSRDLEVKWDGSPAMLIGRDEEGRFHLGDKFHKTLNLSPEAVRQSYLGRSSGELGDERRDFVESMVKLWPLYEQATPKDFRGFLEVGLLYKTRPPLINGQWVFQPNTVIYKVDENSELGKRIKNSISASAATGFFKQIPGAGGQREAVGSHANGFGSDKVIIIPRKTSEVQVKLSNAKIDQISQFIKQAASRIEQFITPSQEWTETFKNQAQAVPAWRQVIYKYVNSQVDVSGGLDSLGSNMLKWAETDNILSDRRRPIAIEQIKRNVGGMRATFMVVRAIMHLKDEVVNQVEKGTLGSLGISAELPTGVSGGEGFVDDPSGGTQPLKFVKRSAFTAANRAKDRAAQGPRNTELADKAKAALKEQPDIIKIQKSQINIQEFERAFGELITEDNGRPRSSRATEQKFLKYAMENSVNPLLYYFVLNQQIEKKYHGNKLVENINDANEKQLKTVFEQFARCGNRVDGLKAGDKKCLLVLTAEDYGVNNRTIRLEGFAKPKKIVKFTNNELVFDDGDTYPSRVLHPLHQIRMWKQIALFDSPEQLKKCLTVMSLLKEKIKSVDGDWQWEDNQIMESFNQGKKKYSESNEAVKTGFPLKFNTTTITADKIYEYYKLKYKNYQSESFPQRMVSGLKKLNESEEHLTIKPYIDRLLQLDFPKSVKVGDSLAVLDFEINFAWKEIAVRGFIKPKTITRISHSGGKINYVEFEDGDRYPRQTPAVYSGRPAEYSVYFKKQNQAEQALTIMTLAVPDGWNLDISEIDRGQSDTLAESANESEKSKTAVVGWGRGMGHSGHMYLAESVIEYAKKIGATPYFFVSETVGKDDPLPTSAKLSIYRTVFPEYKNIFHSAKTIIPALTEINEAGYDNLVFIVGADQKDSFGFLGKQTKDGRPVLPFDSVKIMSRQETGSKTSNLEGPRATPMREILKDTGATTEEKFEFWREAMPAALSDRQVMAVMRLAAHNLGFPIDNATVNEADNPNYFGGSSMSAIPGTPPDLSDTRSLAQIRRDAIKARKKELELRRWMGHHG